MSNAETFDTFDYVVPGLRLGAYSLQLTQEIADGDAPLKSETQTFGFTVVAPRLRLADDEVHASFPPAGGEANYKLTLPHLVLKRRTLPWERYMGPDEGVPWLGLVLLGEAELAGDARLISGNADQLAPPAAPDGVLRPAFAPPLTAAEQKEAITYLEISEALFRKLCPRRTELSALAHVRQVDLTDKADARGAGKGDFAVLVSKRFPQVGGNTAFLVSLEGWETWLATDTADAARRMRVVVLHAWPFKSLDNGGGTFRGRVEGLERNPPGPLAIGSEPDWDEAVTRALDLGFVPIAHQPGGGRKSVAWYRGPLSPVLVAPRPGSEDAHDRPPLPSPLAGIPDAPLDISHLSAWHLGRVLALSSASYTAAVRRWNHVKAMERMKAGVTGERRALTLVDALAGYLEARRDSDPDKQTDPLLRDAMAIADWLGRLLQLAPVPLRYLAPSSRLLPPETLRGFHVDRSWTIDALAMGALSYCSESVRVAPVRRSCGDVRAALWRLFEYHRQILANGKRDTFVVPVDRPMTGFLLRSRLLHEYPGVEITLWSGTEKVRPLRFERVSDDVLLVLAYGEPDALHLREPREGLRFGCEQDWTLKPVPDGQADRPPPLDLANYFVKDATSVLDVAALAGTLGAAGSGARFARHWMRRPTDSTITWEHVR
jgi:hypothetical protein